MRTIREILRLCLTTSLSDRQIARSVRCSHTTVARYAGFARQHALEWTRVRSCSDGELRTLLRVAPPTPPAEAAATVPMPAWDRIHVELARKGVTLKLLWREYVEENPGGYRYSRFCDLYRQWASKLDVSMRMRHVPGEKLFVDYAGMSVDVIDPASGEAHAAQIFVAALGYSHMIYAEATATQKSEDWISSHVRALEFFGGVPAMVVPDNLKSGILRPCRYDPETNPAYLDLAEYYGMAIIPARVRHPKDKAKVEKAVQIIEYEALAVLRDRRYFSLPELNRDIRQLIERINDRPFQKLDGTRRSVFEAFDKPALRPLPTDRYVPATWSTSTVGPDYHVAVDRRYYSVPYKLHGHTVTVRCTPTTIEIFHEHLRVATHVRSYAGHGFSTTIAEHMPSSHRRYADWTPQRILRWAADIGPSTSALAEHIMAKRRHPEQGFRTCMGLIQLRRGHSNERIESMAAYALRHGVIRLKSMRYILKHRLDEVRDNDPVAGPSIIHENIRGPQAFANILPLFEDISTDEQQPHHHTA